MLGRGLLPQNPATRVVRAPAGDHHLIRGALKSLRGSADLSPMASKVLNQGQSSTCWAHSAVTCDFIRKNTRAGSAVAVLQSPLYFAQVVYAQYRAALFPAGQIMPPLQDTGAQLDDCDRAFGQWGSARFQEPAQDGETDVPATDQEGFGIPELSTGELQAGAAALFAGPYDIAPGGNAPEIVAACLDAGVPVWMGGPVTRALDNLQAGQVEQPADLTDPSVGGHARAIIGYRTVAGALEFLVRNSWSHAWGDGGNSWAVAGVIAGAWSLLPFDLTGAS